MTAPDRFQWVQQEYSRLRGQLASGAITQQQFEATVQQLAFQDAQGRHWMIGVDSGRWFVFTGQAWVEANPFAPHPYAGPPPVYQPAPQYPPPQPYAPVPPAYYPPPKKSGGCGRWIACGCITVIVLIVLGGVGGYLAYQSGMLSMATVLNLLGMGPATVEVDNFRDDAVNVTITRLDPPPDSALSPDFLTLNPFDVLVSTVPEPGRYEVKFVLGSNGQELGVCNLSLKSGDTYQFVPMPDRIVVNNVSRPAAVGSDLVVSSSSLCR
jgi:hypothetical protein